jgi:hypothetical protein
MKARTVLVVLLGMALVAGLVACSGGGDTADTGTTTNTGAQSEEPAANTGTAEQPSAEPIGVGQPGTSGDWTVTVKEVERDDSAGGIDAASGNEMVVIQFDLTNAGSTDQGTGPTYFELKDEGGAVYQAAQTSGEEFIFNTPQPITAGETRKIRIAYEVPTGTGPFTWTFTPFVEGGGNAPAVFAIE